MRGRKGVARMFVVLRVPEIIAAPPPRIVFDAPTERIEMRIA